MKSPKLTRLAALAMLAFTASTASANGTRIEIYQPGEPNRLPPETRTPIQIGGTLQHLSEAGVQRAVFEAVFRGFTEEGAPYEMHRILAVEARLGVNLAGGDSSDPISQLEFRVVPYEWSDRVFGGPGRIAISALPTEFSRNTPFGTQERLIIRPIEVSFEGGIPENGLFMEAAGSVLGYMYQNIVTRDGQPLEGHGVEALQIRNAYGFRTLLDPSIRLTIRFFEMNASLAVLGTPQGAAMFYESEIMASIALAIRDSQGADRFTIYARGGGQGRVVIPRALNAATVQGVIEIGIQAAF